MKQNKSWFSLIGYCLATVFGTALAFALILAGGSVALASHQNEEETQGATPNQATQKPAPQVSEAPSVRPADVTTFSGLVTDSYCGARHRRRSNLTSTECAATCIRAGASPVLIDGEHIYHLSGAQQSLSKFLGTRARITGTRQGDTITVTSAGPAF